ncbi:MAG: MFS transporter [Holosporaceae bacterium]|nr:MFS transporter [Holosporaceae bacterium]
MIERMDERKGARKVLPEKANIRKLSTKKMLTCKNPWIIWGIANVFYLYEVILRVSPSVMTEGLMSHYHITAGVLGIMISFFYYSYTLLQVPCGLILDKVGPRNLVGSSVILSTIGTLLFAATDIVGVAAFGRCMVGAGAACAFISCLQIASVVFPIKSFAIFAGITNMMGTAGALCGGFPVAKCTNALGIHGWRNTEYLLAVVGVMIAIVAFTFIPKTMQLVDHNSVSRSFSAIFKQVMRNRQIILVGLVGGFMYLPVSAFSELWAVPFFSAEDSFSGASMPNNEIAALASSMLFIGFAVGSVPVAMLAKKVGGYMKIIRVAIIAVALLFIPLIYVKSMLLSFLIMFVIGLLTAAEVLVFTCAKNNESAKNSGTAIAFANGLLMLVGAVFQPVLGMLLDVFWAGECSVNGAPIYSQECYQKAILTLPICLILAYGLSLFVRETMHMEKENSSR